MDGSLQHPLRWRGTVEKEGHKQRQNTVSGETEKTASQIVDQIRLGGINVSELARQGLQEKLREVLSDEVKITLHQRYTQGELSEEVAEILLGDSAPQTGVPSRC